LHGRLPDAVRIDVVQQEVLLAGAFRAADTVVAAAGTTDRVRPGHRCAEGKGVAAKRTLATVCF
jgi:hypothetical protein